MQFFLTTCRVRVVNKQGTALAIFMTSNLPVQCFLTICTAGGQKIITALAIYMTGYLPVQVVNEVEET